MDGVTSNFVYSVPADADAEFVYNMAKWLNESHDAYKGTHPLAARMSLELFRGYLDRTPLPVHEGTVRYLREIGQGDRVIEGSALAASSIRPSISPFHMLFPLSVARRN